MRYHFCVSATAICEQVLHAKPATTAAPHRVFLLSPANAAGKRARLLMCREAQFDLALRLRNGGLPLGEAFSFISGLYFRGKLAYATAFAAPPGTAPGVMVITACGGLIAPDQKMTLVELRRISRGEVDENSKRYREPLERDARALAVRIGPDCDVVLLGSVATRKYVEPLLDIFGRRLVFPCEFAGRGDMSRGGLMLRCVRAGVQLTYARLGDAARHGRRPPKLEKLIA